MLVRYSFWCVLLLCFCGIAQVGKAQRFAALGDFGYAGPAESDVSALIHSWNPDFVITMGDNNYEYGEASTIDQNIGQYYHDYIYPYQGTYGTGATQNKFFPCIGNHDAATNIGQPYVDYFGLPGNERYYDYVRGNVHFFVLNSDQSEPDGTSSTSVQAQWLQAALRASTSPWKIVYFHHPAYTSGLHGPNTYMRWPFQAWGASAVMAGHDHHYERILVNGFPYFVNGSGGAQLYPAIFLQQGSQIRYSANYGAMLIEATSAALAFKFYTRSNQLVDTYTLTRTPLPVTLASFQARRNGAAADLTWTTAIEQNNRGFAIEASADGQLFEQQAFVEGAGSSQTPHYYQFTDHTIGTGIRYYRLRQEDYDGHKQYSMVRAVVFEAQPMRLEAFPNPFQQELKARLTISEATTAAFSLTDDLGRMVWHAVREVPVGSSIIAVPAVANSGLYLLSVEANGKVLRCRVARE